MPVDNGSTDDTESPPPPSSYFLLMALIFAINMAGTTLPAPLYPLYQHSFGFSNLTVSVIFATYAVGVLGALVITGPWSDQLGRRPVLFAGLLASALSALLFLYQGSLPILLLARLLSGISAGLFTATATIAVIELAPLQQRGRAALAAGIANMGGLGMGPLIAGLLSQYAFWPLHLPYLLHLALILVAVVLLWHLPETVTPPPRLQLRRQPLGLPPEVRALFVPAAVACFAGFAVLGLFTSLAPAVMSQILGLTDRAGIGTVIFTVFAASLAGQMIQRRIPDWMRLPLACVALFIGVGLLGLSIASGALLPLVVAALIAGAGQGAIFAASIAAIAEASPPGKKAEVTSLLFAIAYVAISVPIVSLGLAIEAFGLRDAGIAFTAAIMLSIVFALLALWRLRRQAPSPV
ncbi:MFS transporter [Microbulbifer halophilus]|uniref:MFS transporter n=2 Tax=Microbulbifer halophilus TaxID=453963 RepID=A0ABW5EGM7_9GAMM|nr:MFS transporter [Microbulbifer halophilus]